MGCGSSSEVSNPGQSDTWDDDVDFNEVRTKRDKASLKVCSGVDDGGKDDDDRDDDYLDIDADEPRHGFSGQIEEPDNHNEVNLAKPDTTLELEYVYGYRAIDSRQNLHFNESGQAVYMTAALGVVLDPESNTQKYFGGGEVDCTAKNVARDTNHHTDDIMSLAMCAHRKMAVSGQVGSRPTVFVWWCSGDNVGEKITRIKLPKGSRGVAAVAFSEDNKKIACVDLHNEHHVYAYDTMSGQSIMKANGDTNRIRDVAWSKKPGSTRFATAGTRHIYFWDASDPSYKKKGIFSGKPMTSMSAVVWDSDDICYTAGSNGAVYKWGTDRVCMEVVQAHKKGYFACAIALEGGKLYTGGKDKKICVIDPASMTVSSEIQVDSMPRAIDVMNDKMLVGFRDGTIKLDDKVLMRSHCDGEVWGLDYIEGQGPVTSADDNKVLFWDENKRECCNIAPVTTSRKVNARRGGASTMADNYDSQQSRAVAVNGEWLVFATNDGAVTVRKVAAPATPIGEGGEDMLITGSSEWIEVLQFSPDGSKLAVGSHDDKVRVYDVTDNFSLIGTCSGHSSYILSLDWSADGSYIRTNSGDYELLFWQIPSCDQDPSGASNTKGTEWATNTVKIAWHVRGIWPKGVDGTHINGVNTSPDGSLIVTADDFGLVSLWNNPCRPGANPRCYRGHSEHVVRAKFSSSGDRLFSIGGYDQTVMQYKKC